MVNLPVLLISLIMSFLSILLVNGLVLGIGLGGHYITSKYVPRVVKNLQHSAEERFVCEYKKLGDERGAEFELLVKPDIVKQSVKRDPDVSVESGSLADSSTIVSSDNSADKFTVVKDGKEIRYAMSISIHGVSLVGYVVGTKDIVTKITVPFNSRGTKVGTEDEMLRHRKVGHLVTALLPHSDFAKSMIATISQSECYYDLESLFKVEASKESKSAMYAGKFDETLRINFILEKAVKALNMAQELDKIKDLSEISDARFRVAVDTVGGEVHSFKEKVGELESKLERFGERLDSGLRSSSDQTYTSTPPETYTSVFADQENAHSKIQQTLSEVGRNVFKDGELKISIGCAKSTHGWLDVSVGDKVVSQLYPLGHADSVKMAKDLELSKCKGLDLRMESDPSKERDNFEPDVGVVGQVGRAMGQVGRTVASIASSISDEVKGLDSSRVESKK